MFLEQTVNEASNDKCQLTPALLIDCQLSQILLARQIQIESNRSSHVFAVTPGMALTQKMIEDPAGLIRICMTQLNSAICRRQ